jgi:hypothetical protein
MADSGISFKLFLDSAGFTSGVKAARDAMKNLIDETGKKGFFEKLNTDVKRFSTSFAQLGNQISGGDIFGALATSSGLASSAIGELGSMALPLAAVATAAVAVGISYRSMWNSMSNAKELKSAAEGSLMTVKELTGLEQAFGKVGISVEELPTLMNHFLDSLVQLGDPASKVSVNFARLGLSAGSFKNKTLIESFYTLSDAIQNAKNKSEALLVVQDAFGVRRAGRAFSVFNEGALEQSQANVLKSAEIYDKMGDAFIRMQYSLTRMIPAFDSFFAGLLSKVVPVFESLAAKIERMDFTAVGEKVGSAIATLFGIFDKINSGVEKLRALFEVKPWDVITNYRNAKKMTSASEKEEFEWQEKRREQLIPGYKAIAYSKEAAEQNPIGSAPNINSNSMSGYRSTDRSAEVNIPILPMPIIAPIVDSLTKIGGGGLGGNGTGIDVQREQLNVLQDISTAIKNFAATFRPTKNPYMPSMYGDQSLVS